MRVLITDPIHEDGIELLKSNGFQVDLAYDITHEELKSKVKDYEVLIVRSRTKVTREIIDAAEKLKVIGRAGVGLDNIDLKAAEERGIKVFSSPEAPSTAVAELVFGLLLALYRKIVFCDKSMKEGKWVKRQALGFELKGKTLGIIGLGRIGREVASRAKAFGMRIIYYDVYRPSPEVERALEAEFKSFREVLSEADIITIHVPLTPKTRHMIGREELALMKPNAVIVNTSRGAVIDTKALLEALKGGKLLGACLDVFEHEPPSEPWELELVKLPNVVATPHIGAMTVEAQRAAAVILANKTIDYFKRKTL
ncbi:MAG: 3-phosphoglycerate dehydrogenase [Candidatus Methanomethylicota archaeon]|uniref:3-phosphoglycerate dehydrogenase n=1 Tax=Thermoproteota archaeon TaxID=2056631 RepID=A0A497EXN5_9CREN|nr:MAG: 3-phosphoglycerate dehydrogenase [Candidatus Verstraetearchaeota archaeon]RLE54817.1 MAG: 3-phosphoglycerate dehydrogenase [Candidatus Verstraetearchaeota archaeon]